MGNSTVQKDHEGSLVTVKQEDRLWHFGHIIRAISAFTFLTAGSMGRDQQEDNDDGGLKMANNEDNFGICGSPPL